MAFRVIRDANILNNVGDFVSGTLTTTNNTATALATYTPPADSVVYFTVIMVGRRTDGANAGDGAALTLTCAYKNIAGVLTQIGTDTAASAYASASINASAATSAISSKTIQFKVAGVANATINWVTQTGIVVVAI